MLAVAVVFPYVAAAQFTHNEDWSQLGSSSAKDYTTVWVPLHQGLHCRRFDDLDFVSRSQVCQKYKLHIGCFGCLSSVVQMFYGSHTH